MILVPTVSEGSDMTSLRTDDVRPSTGAGGAQATMESDPLLIPPSLRRTDAPTETEGSRPMKGGPKGGSGDQPPTEDAPGDKSKSEGESTTTGRWATLRVDDILVGDRLRGLDERTVGKLAESMRLTGLIQPIVVCRYPGVANDETRLVLVAGRHRLEAAKKLGWDRIDCSVTGGAEGDDLDRELCEIDENLMRAELTELERGEHHLRRREILESKGAVRTHGGDRNSSGQNAHLKSYADDAAAQLRVGPTTVRRSIRRARKIPEDLRDAIRDKPAADSGAELDALAAMTGEDQERAVKLYTNNEVASIRGARLRFECKVEPSQDEKDEDDFNNIRAAWKKSGEGGRHKFESWLVRKPDVATKASRRPAREGAAPAPARDLPTASNLSGPDRDRDEAPAAGSADGKREARLDAIDVDKMMKDDMLRFVRTNELPGFHGETIPQMREALKEYLQANDAPEGGYKF